MTNHMIWQRMCIHGDACQVTSVIRCLGADGPRHLLNTPRTVPNLQLRSIIYGKLFHINIQCVFHETITAISLWHHSRRLWDIEVSIASIAMLYPTQWHSNVSATLPRKENKGIRITYKKNKGIWIPYKENQGIWIYRSCRLYQG